MKPARGTIALAMAMVAGTVIVLARQIESFPAREPLPVEGTMTPAEKQVSAWIWARGRVVEANTIYSNSMMEYLVYTGFNPIEEMSTSDLRRLVVRSDAMLDMLRAVRKVCDLVQTNFGVELLRETRCTKLDDDEAHLEQDRWKIDARLASGEKP